MALAARLESLDAAESRRRRQSLTAAGRASQIEGRARRAENAAAAYRRQLESALSGGYVHDYVSRRIEIAALESAVQASIVPAQRTYFEERLAQARTALIALEAAEQQAQREARRTANEVLEVGAEGDARMLEATLRREREQAARRTRARLAAEARSLDEDLAAVREQLAALARSGGAKGAPPLSARAGGVAVTFAVAAPSAAAKPETLAQVRAQRDRLRAALLADLRARVRAAAQARNLAVTFNGGPLAGRTAPADRTLDFSRWLDNEGKPNAAAAS